MLTQGMTSSVPWLEEIAARNGRPVMIAAMFVDPNDPERVFRELDEIGDAKGRGRELWGQVGCFPLGMEFCLSHPYPLEAFLAWRPAIEASDGAEFRRILADSSFRDAVKAEARTAGVPNRFSYHQWDHMRIMESAKPENRDLVGRVVGDLAREAGNGPLRLVPRLLPGRRDGFAGGLPHVQRGRGAGEGSAEAPARRPRACRMRARTFPSSATPDSGCTCSDTGRAERADMSLEGAVQAVTSRLADVYRIKERGRLEVGACADLLLFDPENVGRGERERKWDLPAGAGPRAHSCPGRARGVDQRPPRRERRRHHEERGASREAPARLCRLSARSPAPGTPVPGTGAEGSGAARVPSDRECRTPGRPGRLERRNADMLGIEKVDHIGIRVSDKSVSIAFYERLGFETLSDTGFKKDHPVIMRHSSGVVLNLLGPSNTPNDRNILMDGDENIPGSPSLVQGRIHGGHPGGSFPNRRSRSAVSSRSRTCRRCSFATRTGT